MSVPRHFSQRPRRKMAPPPNNMQAHHTKSVELPEVELPEAELPEVELPEVDLPEAELPETELPETELPEVDLPETELPEAELLPETELPEAELPEADVKALTWSAAMKKADLLKIAQDLNLPVTEADTKAALLTALESTRP